MFGLTRREQRWKAEQQAAEALIPMITAIKVEAMKQNDKDATIERLTTEVAGLRDQLHLAEVVRAAQVEGLTQGAAGWRERANQLKAEVAGLREALLHCGESLSIFDVRSIVRGALAARKGEA